MEVPIDFIIEDDNFFDNLENIGNINVLLEQNTEVTGIIHERNVEK